MALRDRFRSKAANTDAINQGLWSVAVGQADAAYPAGLSLYEGFARDYLTMYRSQPAVRFVIDFIARNIAQVPLKTYRRTSDTDRKSLPGHPFQEFVKYPNREDTEYTWKRDLVTYLCIYDMYVGSKVAKDDLLSVTPLYPDAVSFLGGDALGPAAFRLTNPDGTTIDYDRKDVFWLHGFGSRRGIPPMETLRRILAEDDAAGRHREGSYKNNMRQAGVIERPLDAPPWDSDTRKAFRDNLTARYSGGANAGKPLILEEGMTWKGDQTDTKDSEYITSRTFTMKAVAHAFHVSPQMLGIEGAPYASVSAYHNYLYQDTLAPLLEFLTQGMEKQLLPEFSDTRKVYIEFAIEAKLRGSFEEQAQIITSAVGGPWMTVNEARALRNLPPVDAGDEIITPLNVVRGGGEQPEPGTPTETPSSAPKALAKARKADRGAVRRRDGYAAEIEKTLTGFFDRQQRQVKALSGRGKATLSNPDRWRRELAKDLRPLFEKVTVAEGKRKAAQLGGDYDPDKTEHYLDKGSELMSSNINDSVAAELEANDDTDHVFGVVLASLAARVAIGQATHLQAFAREEAAKQAGASTKVWSVTSAKSRHPEMNGATAPVGEPFSNGMAYPGDPSAGADQSAGCQCVLDIEAAAPKAIEPPAPVFNISNPVTVNLPEQKTMVEAPHVNVEAPQITVDPPDVKVNVEPAQVTVNTPPPSKSKKVVKRDKSGQIVGLEEV